MYPYIPNTPDDEQIMLESIGLTSIDQLFDDIPSDVHLKGPLNIPTAKSELEVKAYLTSLSKKNCSLSEMPGFIGAGAYDHYIPSIINHIISRSEFYTSYTPYQPEISQGTLQYIFEYQTLICNLTGMDVANASIYDGGTAAAEAVLMAAAVSKKDEIIISKTLNPNTKQVIKTYAHMQSLKVVEVDMKDGITDLEALDKAVNENTAAVLIQSPNFLG